MCRDSKGKAVTDAMLRPCILITGASGAIGGEIAAQAAAAGHTVGVHGASPVSVDAAIERLTSRVPVARFIPAPADFRSDGAIETMVEAFARNAGGINAVIHCGIAGGRGITGPFSAIDPKGLADHAALVLGTFQRLCWAALPHLSQQGGTIIGFASDAGRFASPRRPAREQIRGCPRTAKARGQAPRIGAHPRQATSPPSSWRATGPWSSTRRTV